MSTCVASERYGTSLAPDGLRLTQELANTIGHPRPPVGSDLLAEVSGAQAWLDEQVMAWCERHQVANPEVNLTPSRLRQLQRLRAEVRAHLGGDEDSPTAAPLPSVIAVTTRTDDSHLAPTGSGIAWLRGAIAIELLIDNLGPDARRVKMCRNPDCGVAFYDRSKNNSRTWHDLAKCGNVANVRAYRERQRTNAPSTEADLSVPDEGADQ